jgi:transcriptional regulator with XRE-family HTH domain
MRPKLKPALVNDSALSVGQLIRERRLAVAKTLSDIARLLEITPQTLFDLESGRRYPSEKVKARIVKVLNIDERQLESVDPRPLVRELKHMFDYYPDLIVAFREELRNIEDGIDHPKALAADIIKRARACREAARHTKAT